MPRLALCALLLVVLPALTADPPKKKVLTHADQDIWATTSGVSLSPDGKFVAYITGTPNADAQFVLKNVATGTETKIPTGSRLPAAPGAPTGDEDDDQPAPPTPVVAPPVAIPPVVARGPSGGPVFSPDSKFVFVPLLPLKAEMDKARADKKKPEDYPKGVLAMVDTATGQITKRKEKVKSFSVVGDGAGVLLCVMDAPPAEPVPPPKPTDPKPATPTPPKPATGTDLLVVNLADSKECTFADVLSFSLTRDAKNIALVVAAKDTTRSGVFFAPLLDVAATLTLKSGTGRYYSLTWNRDQTKLAFFFDPKPTTPTAAPPVDPLNPIPPPALDADALARQPRVYVWERPSAAELAKAMAVVRVAAAFSPLAMAATVGQVPAANELIGPGTPGLKKGWQIVDRGGLSFSADGSKLVVNAAPEPPPAPLPTAVKETKGEGEQPTTPNPLTPGPSPVAGRGGQNPPFDLQLWHWKDEAIQPMQKLSAGRDRNKSFRCVYLLDDKELRHLADDDREAGAPAYGDWSVGRTDKPYRAQTWRSPNPSDFALVNVRSGESKPLLTAHESGVVGSPHGRSVAWFDGKDWFAASVADGKPINLTAKLGSKFVNEEFDMPMTAPAYGLAGWSHDDLALYVYDRHDLWHLNADGSGAKNLTKEGRSNGVRLRLLRVEQPEDDTKEPEPGLDPTKPWLLSAENLTTRDTGFYRLLPTGGAKLLLMGARRYGVPIKAKKADVQLLTAQTFQDFPDYYATDANFKEVKRLTDLNPRVKEYNWGTSELVNFKNTDGQPLQAVLVKPENFDPNKKYPLIVYIYERLTDQLHTFRPPSVTRGQVVNPTYYASNGYLVLMPDITYKTGQPGQSALKCVLPALQAVVDKGYVNEQAVGINGQSWGGYQIAYLVTQTDRFKAAVAGAPVSNMVSAYNGIRWGSGLPRQFQYEHTQSRIGGTPWTAPLKFIENSPVFHADKVTTPLMMIHNDADDAVPWYQGIEYYLALRRLNKEAYLLNYTGQPHNLSNKTAARDFAVRMDQFFAHHLKGEKMPEWMEKGVPYLEREKEKEQWRKLFEPAK